MVKIVRTFLAAALLPLAASAAEPARWIMADDVRVREVPSAEQKAIGALPRGAEVFLTEAKENNGFCHIHGEGQNGWVSCKFLSAQKVARARSGVDGVPANQRWAGGSALIVRETPSPSAAVVGQLPLNTVVTLLKEEPGGAYCQVQPVNGALGYTACRYLVHTPVVLAHIKGDITDAEKLSPNYDPERAFWLKPSWAALEQYVATLKKKTKPEGPWPRDEALERMKAHLALGLNGRKPSPYADWAALKRKTALPASKEQTEQLASLLQNSLTMWSPLHDASDPAGAARMIALVRALELPAVQPSLFRSEADLAPPSASAEEVSGRFGIIYRQVISPRKQTKEGSPGVYDMQARTLALVKSVPRVQLFRDGKLTSEPSVVRKRSTLWGESDEPMCHDWVPGFSFGAADAGPWRYFEGEAQQMQKENTNPAGSLFAFYVKTDLPRTQATLSAAPMKLNRNETGFSGGTHLNYDVDGDGVLDLSIWEGMGKGPGHMDGVTKTDDRWYRLAFVNINGAWKILGSDLFGYGCGC